VPPGNLPAWLTLGVAIAAEVIGTSALKAADGFTRLLPSLVVAMAYAVSFYALSLTLRSIPVGIAYAIWSGIGMVLLAVIGWVVYGQKLDAAALVGMGFILVGVLVIQLVSKAGHG
jgi:multidrug transporter EmrE-like cation transporter